MTAIEVLAATLLSSLMFASVMGVMASLVRQQKTLRLEDKALPWHKAFCEQLRWDLQNTRSYSVDSRRLILEGFAGRDFATHLPTGQATEVEYFLLDTATTRLLIRRETHMEARANNAWRSEVVCRGVTKLEFGSTTLEEPSPASVRRDQTQEERKAPMPPRVAVRLFVPTSDTPVIDEDFAL